MILGISNHKLLDLLGGWESGGHVESGTVGKFLENANINIMGMNE